MFLPGEFQGAWWAAICVTAQSRTRLNQLKQQQQLFTSSFMRKFSFFLSFFKIHLFNFTILYWFCHMHWLESTMDVHVFPILKPLPSPSPSHPSGSSQCISPEYPVSKLDWRFVSHKISYMFQCHSWISSHPCPLSQSPKDCSIHPCLLWFYLCISKKTSLVFFDFIFLQVVFFVWRW